ncbi:MAG: CRISPR-associated endonuclease Cas1 [Succinivibrio sp.]
MTCTAHTLHDFLSRRKKTLYFTHQVCNVALDGNSNLVFRRRHGAMDERVNLDRIRRVVVVGRIGAISSAVFYKLMSKHIPVDFMDVHGKCAGQLMFESDQADFCWTLQHERANAAQAIAMAREIITVKIDNCREVIRRLAPQLGHWDYYRSMAANAPDLASLRGIEGSCAREYFQSWKNLTGSFPWVGRKKHPAPDPVNSMLSFGYTLLYSRIASALRARGLNPRLGFFHESRGTHCALASDLMEQFRPLIDRAVLAIVRKRVLAPSDFACRNGSCTTSNHKAFAILLNTFEEMFEETKNFFTLAKDGAWEQSAASPDDLFDELASNYASRLGGANPAITWRLRPCSVI